MNALNGLGPVGEYWRDAWQRSVLFLDVLRQRGNAYFQHQASEAPHVLNFKAELVRDGRTLPRPVNYLLVRIVPPEGTRTEATKPPFIVVDPRAGHGPGIGGMKQDSEIGVALAAGHPCYFIGFLPEPVPGQTVEDVCRAEAAFVEEVAARHPLAEGKPVIIANCQAGWQILMMAALRPELAGPILVAGSPLSYWAGVRGKNPLRYLGGILGGTWLTALSGDVGKGIFDGAHLVANFESLDPANTYWKKLYNVYSKVDSEAPRFLDFETWWGSPVLLNAEEMQWIADNLFVGNKLTAGQLSTSDGQRIDLRNITSPIVVLCSWGDNITPPQQALGWICRPVRQREGHRRQGPDHRLHAAPDHRPPRHLRLGQGRHQGARRVRQLHGPHRPAASRPVRGGHHRGGRGHGEPASSSTASTCSAWRHGRSRTSAPWAPTPPRTTGASPRRRASRRSTWGCTAPRPGARCGRWCPNAVAKALRQLHPHRLQFAWFSDRNPLMWPVKGLADWARTNRVPAAADNPLSHRGADGVQLVWSAPSKGGARPGTR